jgi:sterol desaturase/sphingolipid hydroxylase (fatty acid hydroxylase superfamily)
MLSGFTDRLVTYFWSFGVAVVLCTWLVSLAGAVFTYLYQTDVAQKSVRGFVTFCFPAVILRHPSCRLDIMFVVVGKLIPPILIVPLLVTNVGVALLSYHTVTWLFGAQPQFEAPFALWFGLLAIAVLIQDFMTFYLHYLEHRWAVLWELHKVHHSAEFLLPITNRRFHPLQGIIENIVIMSSVGMFIGVASYIFHLKVRDNSIIGLDAYFVANLLSFYHLRHSHIAMRYGWLERYLISPAQHQLHHSREERHWDCNFGLLFSWWDRWFGTVIYSTSREQFALGLPHDVQHQYSTAVKLYLTPLRNIGRIVWQDVRRRLPRPTRLPSARPLGTGAVSAPGATAATGGLAS